MGVEGLSFRDYRAVTGLVAGAGSSSTMTKGWLLLLTQANCDFPYARGGKRCLQHEVGIRIQQQSSLHIPAGGTRKGERHLGDRERMASGGQGASMWDWAQEPGYIDSCVLSKPKSDPWAHGETGTEGGLTSSSWLLDHLRKGFLEELLTVLRPMGARIKGILDRGCLTHYLAGRRHSCRVFWV